MTDPKDNDAMISSCGKYRYWLFRTWEPGKPTLVFCMLNPSTADASVDDPTIRRCIGFAKRDGYGSLGVVNLYAYRATNPKDMLNAADPVGPMNDTSIGIFCKGRDVVCAWGNVRNRLRVQHVHDTLGLVAASVRALGFTNDGQPRHPLYVKGDAPLVPYTNRFRISAETMPSPG